MNPLIKRYIDATNTHDFNQLLSIIDPQAHYNFSDQVCIGIDQIRTYFENAWNLVIDEVYSAHDIQCIVDLDDVKVFTYEYRYEGYISEKFVQGKGRATNVFKKHKDDFVLVLEHLN